MSALMIMDQDLKCRGRLVRYVLCSCHPHHSSFSPVFSSSSIIIPPANVDLKRGRTNYTAHSSIHDEGIHIASEYTSDANTQTGHLSYIQSNSSHDLITNGAMTEEMTDTPTYIPGQSPNETHLQTDFTNISTNSDHAPPAYDSLPDRPSSVNPSFSQNLEPSTLV